MTGIPLRRRLFVLAAVAILPLALMAWAGLAALARHQRAQAERVGLELARSVANAVDAELRSSVTALATLSSTATIDRAEFEGFRERAIRVLDSRPEWAAIVLSDPGGTPLVDTRARPPAHLPPLAEAESLQRAVRTRMPSVGGLTRDPGEAWAFAVRVPVVRDGMVRFVISALVKPAVIRQVLIRQQVPADWVISIVDGRGLRVARSRAHEENLAGRLSETVQQVVDSAGAEGFGLAYTLEGEHILTPFSRLSTGWVAVLGIPTALVDAAVYRSLGLYGGGVLLSIALATLGALWVARSITRPIADLRRAAEALGRGEPPRPPETAIQEIREVARALKTAGEELSRSEVVREELLRKERLAREAAETADRAKEEFLAVLSHELRTPLNAIYGWSRLLQTGPVPDDPLVTRAVEAIVRNANSQVRLIDDLLDLSRITSGKMRLDVRPTELIDVLQGALDAVRPAADAKGLVIESQFDADVGPVIGDSARLQQILWNLLMNAVKFTPRGGRIRLGLRQVRSHVEVLVHDSGEGITPEILPHIFERFRQADSSSTRRHGGLGLGLALVKHLVEAHGGTVWARSGGKGQGATFVVTLPVALTSAPAGSVSRVHPGALAREAMAGIVRLDGVRVLVVDDDADALALADAILGGAGAEVRTSLSPEEALSTLREWRPHVLVSDIEMPAEDGYWLIRAVRRLSAGEGGETPAIALTAYRRPQDRARSLAEGFTVHLPKPVNPGELTAIVAGIAGRPVQPRAS